MTTQTKYDEALKLALEGAANYIDVLGGDGKKYRQLLAQQSAERDNPKVLLSNEQVEPAKTASLLSMLEKAFWRMYEHGKNNNPASAQCEAQALHLLFDGTFDTVLAWHPSHPPVPYVVEPRTAQPKDQETLAYREAARLAEWLFKTHYSQEEHYASGRVVWGLCDSTAGVISQIDNMVCKLVLPKEPEQEPVAWWVTGPDGEIDWSDEPIQYKEQRPLEELVDGCGYAPLYTTPPTQQSCSQRQCNIKPLTDEMVTAAARELNERQADACGVDRDDQWAIYSDDFKADARAMLEAARGITKE